MLTSLAASTLTWSALSSSGGSSGNENSHEVERNSCLSDTAHIRKRDKKAIVKVIQHKGEVFHSSISKTLPSLAFPGARSILSAAVAQVLQSHHKASLLSKLVDKDILTPKNSFSTVSATQHKFSNDTFAQPAKLFTSDFTKDSTKILPMKLSFEVAQGLRDDSLITPERNSFSPIILQNTGSSMQTI